VCVAWLLDNCWTDAGWCPALGPSSSRPGIVCTSISDAPIFPTPLARTQVSCVQHEAPHPSRAAGRAHVAPGLPASPGDWLRCSKRCFGLPRPGPGAPACLLTSLLVCAGVSPSAPGTRSPCRSRDADHGQERTECVRKGRIAGRESDVVRIAGQKLLAFTRAADVTSARLPEAGLGSGCGAN
jgi:hypothetical protein